MLYMLGHQLMMSDASAMLQVAQFLEKELPFRESVATAINRASTGDSQHRRKRNDVCWNSSACFEVFLFGYIYYAHTRTLTYLCAVLLLAG